MSIVVTYSVIMYCVENKFQVASYVCYFFGRMSRYIKWSARLLQDLLVTCKKREIFCIRILHLQVLQDYKFRASIGHCLQDFLLVRVRKAL